MKDLIGDAPEPFVLPPLEILDEDVEAIMSEMKSLSYEDLLFEAASISAYIAQFATHVSHFIEFLRLSASSDRTRVMQSILQKAIVRGGPFSEVVSLAADIAINHTKMETIDLSQRARRESSKKALDARHAENRDLKAEVFRWCDANLTNYVGRLDDAASDIEAAKLVPLTWRVIRSHITAFRSLQTQHRLIQTTKKQSARRR